ncbi:hypothetical protein [Riemerella anatipestifer]|uniref:Uncharacterized protein n=1 Tax=Riemerella anatipestifer TaxID=34085 RepID=A0A1S7DQV8_RIEAN|nr:hypothetical protein [Riemerella anatipestifer]AQY21505.1 hypothetical protein AB406_0547 [Riemerella anatipestifer]MBO4233974.1 hypothetical protein [Riemerella anatipestifer]MCO4303149.1 hypothetical protein [Riemerella anatipestifer]MCO7353102.1 hypothetical protein [Riemerella anatipestifer]MCQ4039078.1 hypothetical protein [Riemerella anatipestifer]
MRKAYLTVVFIILPICVFSQNKELIKEKVLDSLNLSKESEQNWESYKKALQIYPLNKDFDGTVEGSYLKNKENILFKGHVKSRNELLKIKIESEDRQRKTSITLKEGLVEILRAAKYIFNFSNSKSVPYKEYVKRKSDNQWCFYNISNASKENLGINKEKNTGRCVSIDNDGAIYKIESFVSPKTSDEKDKDLVHNHNFTIEFERDNDSLVFSKFSCVVMNYINDNQIKFIINFKSK